jgi:hypothetical protein
MVSFDILAIVVSILGLAASITYYATVLRNQNETRQAQLFMSIHSQSLGNLTWSNSLRVVLSANWEDFDDYLQKYRFDNPTDKETGEHILHIFNFFEGLGVYVREGLIGVRLVALTMTSPVVMVWEKYEEMVLTVRNRLNLPRWWSEFEYLYHEVQNYNKQHRNNNR